MDALRQNAQVEGNPLGRRRCANALKVKVRCCCPLRATRRTRKSRSRLLARHRGKRRQGNVWAFHHQNYTWEQIHAMYQLMRPAAIPNMQPSFNVCPTESIDTVVEHEGQRNLEVMRWGARALLVEQTA